MFYRLELSSKKIYEYWTLYSNHNGSVITSVFYPNHGSLQRKRKFSKGGGRNKDLRVVIKTIKP